MRARELTEVRYDNKMGWGATGYNDNVEYRGLVVKMTPSTFLALAPPMPCAQSLDKIKDYIKQGGAIGSPFLIISMPDSWFEPNNSYSHIVDNDLVQPARVIGHEGRNRMMAIRELEGDIPVEVHIFGYGEFRARHFNARIINRLNQSLIPQLQRRPIMGPFFTVKT